MVCAFVMFSVSVISLMQLLYVLQYLVPDMNVVYESNKHVLLVIKIQRYNVLMMNLTHLKHYID